MVQTKIQVVSLRPRTLIFRANPKEDRTQNVMRLQTLDIDRDLN